MPWLVAYEGQTTDELLALEGQYRVDSLIVAFEQALDQKAARLGEAALAPEEQLILAVEALEREVNNGGYSQFFQNSSREYVSIIVNGLRRIGCQDTADLTARAIAALGVSELTPDAVGGAMAIADSEREKTLNQCDHEYYAGAEPIAPQLLAFIKAKKSDINLR